MDQFCTLAITDNTSRRQTRQKGTIVGDNVDRYEQSNLGLESHNESEESFRKNRNRLMLAMVLCAISMILECIAGYLASSLALISDAAHLLSDLAAFLVALTALMISRHPPSSRHWSFGFHRVEILGTILSIMLIWALTGILVYEAINRLSHLDQLRIDGRLMFLVGSIGLFVNLLLGCVLHQHHHVSDEHTALLREEHEPLVSHHSHSRTSLRLGDMNVRAAFIHVLGDIIQALGVMLAGLIIWRWPYYQIADPLCTFLFSLLVLITTLTVLKDAFRVLMEATPSHIDPSKVSLDLQSIPGILHVHDLHIWSLSPSRTALAVHLQLDPLRGISTDQILRNATILLKSRYGIQHATMQTEYEAISVHSGS
jgi:solute carrier family 30 (zinc transporter), member 2